MPKINSAEAELKANKLIPDPNSVKFEMQQHLILSNRDHRRLTTFGAESTCSPEDAAVALTINDQQENLDPSHTPFWKKR